MEREEIVYIWGVGGGVYGAEEAMREVERLWERHKEALAGFACGEKSEEIADRLSMPVEMVRRLRVGWGGGVGRKLRERHWGGDGDVRFAPAPAAQRRGR